MGQDLHEIKPAKFLSERMENQEAQGSRKFRLLPFPKTSVTTLYEVSNNAVGLLSVVAAHKSPRGHPGVDDNACITHASLSNLICS